MKRMVLILSLGLALVLPGLAQNANPKYLKSIEKHRKQEHRKFKHPRMSPLRENYRDFDHLEYFPIDEKYRVNARLEFTPDAQPFEMSTSSGKKKQFQKWAIAHFQLDGKDYQLSLYRNLGLAGQPEYKDYLFLPFKDYTNGNGTYGGGRYIETHIPKGDTMVIDFNLAFNPYCAYASHGWNCPIPPEENHLPVEIPAGVKDWSH